MNQPTQFYYRLKVLALGIPVRYKNSQTNEGTTTAYSLENFITQEFFFYISNAYQCISTNF